MPFYGGGTKDTTKSDIEQGKFGNCYVVAPVAAYSLCGKSPDLKVVVGAVGYGMGGTSDRAFKAMALYPFNTKDESKWKKLITTCVDKNYPACLGISWKTVNKESAGNHVVYITGYEGTTVYARDQQNDQVLIIVTMSGSWDSAEFVVGKNTHRTCKVSWVGVGFPSKDAARECVS